MEVTLTDTTTNELLIRSSASLQANAAQIKGGHDPLLAIAATLGIAA